MSEHIVHVCVMEDCFNIIKNLRGLNPGIRHSATQEYAFGVTASTTMSGDTYTVPLLKDLREKWPNRKIEDHLEAKLAFVLGWTSHRAADRQMKPLFRETVSEETRKTFGNECTYYHEAFMYRQYFMNKPGDPFDMVLKDRPEKNPNYGAFDVPGTQKLFQAMLKSAFMSMHTIKPLLTHTTQEVEQWIENIYGRLQEFKIFNEKTAAIVAMPDAEKTKRYITDPNFFDESDPLIILAKKLREDKEVTVEEALAALDPCPKSHYAKALKTAIRYVQAASDYFDGKIDELELKTALDVGKKGRDGQSV